MPDSFSLGIGFVLELEKLELLLQYISHGAYRWEIVNDDAEESADRQSAVIRYSNPGGIDLPSQISFRFPCLTENNLFFSVRFVCLHPGLADPVSRGLYFEEGEIKYDCLEDWGRFWPPIKQALLMTQAR
jgi:hypothetical protein